MGGGSVRKGDDDRSWSLRLPVEVGSLSHYLYGFIYTCLVVVWDFWTINSMIPSLKLTICTWKLMVGRWFFLLGKAYFQKWWLAPPCLFSSTQFRVWIRTTHDFGLNLVSHRIHVWCIYLHFHKNQPNVGKYTIHGSYGSGHDQVQVSWMYHQLVLSIGIRACRNDGTLQWMVQKFPFCSLFFA